MLDPARLTLADVERELCSRSFAQFVKCGWHVLEPQTKLAWGWSLDAICEHLEAVHEGQIKRLLINVPPGCMKSLLTGVFFPAWEWGPKGRQDRRFISTAHKQDLAVRDNIKCRDLIKSKWFQERWPLGIKIDQDSKLKFENSEHGFREAMAFTSLTGSRGDRIIIDDPLSVDDARSEAALKAAEATFLEAVPTRVNNENSAIVVIMQRLHERDTSGIIIEKELGYEHLMLPMRYDSKRACTTSIGFRDPRRKEGELLFPERFDENQVQMLERSLGSYAVAGQLQQSPVPDGGGLFKEDWIRRWDRNTVPPSFDMVVASWDMSFKDSDSSDYVAGQIWAKKDASFYLLDQVHDRMDFVRTKAVFEQMCTKWRDAIAKLVEEKANGVAIINSLRSTVPGIIPITPTESKLARASSVAPFWEAGNVYIPSEDEAPWVGGFVHELLSFPNGAHDDRVDAMTQALNYFKASGLEQWAALASQDEY